MQNNHGDAVCHWPICGVWLYGFLFDTSDLVYPIIILGIGMILKLLIHIPFLQEDKRINGQNKSPLQKEGEDLVG